MSLRTLAASVMITLFATAGAIAIEPSHWGKYGNPEEPAMRPYKSFWRGLKAFKYQQKATLDEGRQKAGAAGNVQVVRGVRRGLVEIAGSTYMGMAGSWPTPVEETHPANMYIEADRRRAALADWPVAAGMFWLVGAGSVGTVFGPGFTTVGQSEVDRYAMTPEERAKVAENAAKTRQQNWPASQVDRNTPRPQGLKYTGPLKDADDLKKSQADKWQENPYTGDMVKKARRGTIAN